MGSRGKTTRKSGITHDQKHKIHVYFGFFLIFSLTLTVILYKSYNKSVKDGPEYIGQWLIEFYQDSCQLNPKVGFKTENGLRGAYAKGNFKKNEQVLFGGQGFLFTMVFL